MINYRQDRNIEQQVPFVEEPEYGCKYCYDNRKKQNRELYFFDHANNLRSCSYCPNCGQKIGENKNV